jgi:hypothetical protein
MAQHQLRSAILIIAFKRPELLQNLFESLESTGDLKSKNIVIIQQIGNEGVSDIIVNFQKKYTNTLVKRTDGSGKDSTENISFNRIEGLRICFDDIGAEYVIALEDDVQVASDIFEFTNFIMKKYWDIPRFRGINYGSHENYSQVSSRKYAKARFGLHGPASAITKKTWEKINTSKNIKRSQYIIFDGLFEYYMKTGFMITPENSRYIDLGYGGTHTPENSDNSYFSNLKTSFVGNQVVDKFVYELNHQQKFWQNDALVYKKRNNLKYQILYFANYRNDNFIFRRLERAIYRLFVLKKLTKVR